MNRKFISLLLAGLVLGLAALMAGCEGDKVSSTTQTPSTVKASSNPVTATTSAPSNTVKIKLNVITFTWLDNTKPYDISSVIRDNLEEADFNIVSSTSTDYDAVLEVYYTEKKGSDYQIGTGTSIECTIVLKNTTQKKMFEKRLISSTPGSVTLTVGSIPVNVQMRDMAARNLITQLYFQHLGEFIATKFGRGDEVLLLIKTLEDDPYYAVQALGELRDARAIEPILNVMNDEKNARWIYLKRAGAIALLNLGYDGALEPLIKSLKDEDPMMRQDAVRALGEIGDEKAVAALTEALNDEDWGVRREAKSALAKIQGEQ